MLDVNYLLLNKYENRSCCSSGFIEEKFSLEICFFNIFVSCRKKGENLTQNTFPPFQLLT